MVIVTLPCGEEPSYNAVIRRPEQRIYCSYKKGVLQDFVATQIRGGERRARASGFSPAAEWTRHFGRGDGVRGAAWLGGRGARAVAGVTPAGHDPGMTKYLISFPSAAMTVTADELPAVAAAAHAVIAEAKAAGVYVFGGGIDEQVPPVRVSGDGSVSGALYPGSALNGGFTVLEVPTRDEAVEWARKIAVACRCAQELREFMYDPVS